MGIVVRLGKPAEHVDQCYGVHIVDICRLQSLFCYSWKSFKKDCTTDIRCIFVILGPGSFSVSSVN